jgi:hypothetical protein
MNIKLERVVALIEFSGVNFKRSSSIGAAINRITANHCFGKEVRGILNRKRKINPGDIEYEERVREVLQQHTHGRSYFRIQADVIGLIRLIRAGKAE